MYLRRSKAATAALLLALAGGASAHVTQLARLVQMPEPDGARRTEAAGGGLSLTSVPGTRRDGPRIGQLGFDDVSGRYLLAGANAEAENCAKEIVIGAVEAGGGTVFGQSSGVVAHERISVDGVACDAGGVLEIADLGELAGGKGSGGQDSGGLPVLAQLAVAVDATPRVCGGREFIGEFQLYDDMPRYSNTLRDLGVLPDDGLPDAAAGEIYFPVVTGGKKVDDMDAPAAYCWYRNADRQTDASGRPPLADPHAGKADGGNCFPADATVQEETRGVVRMDALAIGDRVLAGDGRYTPVFMFTHRTFTGTHAFIELRTARHTVRASAGHYLPLADGRLVAAGAVRAGDVLLLGDGSGSAVESAAGVIGVGLFNPQTASGDVVVDGVVASTYTTAVEPSLAQALLAPARAAFRWAGVWTAAFEGGAKGMEGCVPGGAAVVDGEWWAGGGECIEKF